MKTLAAGGWVGVGWGVGWSSFTCVHGAHATVAAYCELSSRNMEICNFLLENVTAADVIVLPLGVTWGTWWNME